MPRKDGEMAQSIKLSPSWKYMLIISVLTNGAGESLGLVCSQISLLGKSHINESLCFKETRWVISRK